MISSSYYNIIEQINSGSSCVSQNKMKILHIVYSDLIGGASKAAYLIHKTLQQNNIESKMLVYKKISNDESVYESKYS